MKINKNDSSLCPFNLVFLCFLQPNISLFFSFIDMLAGYPFCHCVIVLKIGNYTAELKQTHFNDYLYSVFSSGQYSCSFTSASSSMLNSCVVVLHSAVEWPQWFLSWLCSALLRTSPQVHFLEPRYQWFSSSICWDSTTPPAQLPSPPKGQEVAF